ncbi:hypothetical protein ISCGN_002192 [Ixodes scapularis]
MIFQPLSARRSLIIPAHSGRFCKKIVTRGRGIVTETTMTLFLVQMLLSAALSAAQPTAPPGCTLTVNAPFFLDASTFCMVDTPDDPAYIPPELNDESFFAWQPGTISDACLQKHSTQLYQSGRGIVTETTMTLFLVQPRVSPPKTSPHRPPKSPPEQRMPPPSSTQEAPSTPHPPCPPHLLPSHGQTGGGGGRVRSLASSYARILTLVGEDSALGAPGFSVPAFEDEAEGRPTGAQAGHGQQAAEPVPSTSRDVRPPARPRVRPTAPRATPRMSRQERHDEAAMQAVANQTRQVQQNETRDARDVEFQGQLLRSIDTLSHRMEAVAESNQEQARATQAVALELQNTTRVLVEVVLLLTAERSRALRSQDLPSPAQPPLQPSQVQPRPAEPSPAAPSPAEPSPTEPSRAQHR